MPSVKWRPFCLGLIDDHGKIIQIKLKPKNKLENDV